MKRSIVFRSVAMLASTVGVIVGCTGTPTEGELPPTKQSTPEDMEKLRKKIEAEKIAPGASGYKPPPGINLPTK
jgi:hypothetical protein